MNKEKLDFCNIYEKWSKTDSDVQLCNRNWNHLWITEEVSNLNYLYLINKEKLEKKYFLNINLKQEFYFEQILNEYFNKTKKIFLEKLISEDIKKSLEKTEILCKLNLIILFFSLCLLLFFFIHLLFLKFIKNNNNHTHHHHIHYDEDEDEDEEEEEDEDEDEDEDD